MLNESGPEGLIFVDNDVLLDTSRQDHILTPVTPANQSVVTVDVTQETKSPVLPTPASGQSTPVQPGTTELPEARRLRPRRGPAASEEGKPSTKRQADIAPTALLPSAAPAANPGPSTSAPAQHTVPAPLTSSTCSLRAAGPRVVSLHVYNLSEATTTEDVVRHVQDQMGIASPVCQQLVVTRGNYTSFRLDVPANKVKAARDNANWPTGVGIRYFNIVQPKNANVQRASTVMR
ncbi:uncharacterized protein LOC125234215 [Leguminivora glycinivorella]|uniref:uncharacterized protein LOC125234215 n=1 Tax=Leguminivora glycinivorella TaxID=1035111 RepID=UPI00200FB081|nr:uncharacterized protein LOC125234215 [Leguminivora glycinivorella]